MLPVITKKKQPKAAPKKKASKKASKHMPMPSSTADGPIYYKTGKIYRADNKRCFRAIRLASDYFREKQVYWKAATPTAAKWKECLKETDAYKPKKP